MMGIYCYEDTLNNNEIVYIGKDSHIEQNRRHRQHLQLSMKDSQPFNQVLQKNPERYNYEVLCKGDCDDELINTLEIGYIQTYNPRFNFTGGGEGQLGRTPWNKGIPCSEETREKLRKINTGKKLSKEHKKKISNSLKGKNNPFYGKKHSKETREKLSKSHKGNIPWNKGKPCSETVKQAVSKANKGNNHGVVGEKCYNYRKDIPSPSKLLTEYNNSNITFKQLAVKYNCSVGAIQGRIRKARKEEKNDGGLK